MSNTKRYFVYTILALFSVWPLLHRIVVLQFDVDPWRNFGLAMYCVVNVNAYVDYAVSHRGQAVLHDPVGPSYELDRVRTLYGQKRLFYGTFASPAPLVKLLFESYPDADEVVIRFRKVYLSPRTDHLETLQHTYRFLRDAQGQILSVGESFERDTFLSSR